MELKKVSFEVNKKAYITKEERDFLVEAYRKLFMKIYGCDMLEVLANLTKTSSNKWLKRRKGLQKYAENQIRALDVMDSVENDENFDLLVIRDEESKLIGGGRLRRISDTEASIPDIAIEGVSLKEEREIWRQAVMFAEEYFTSLGYEKMYVEIPIQDGPLLGRAGKLGFVEDPKDMRVTDATRTYLVNKTLGRVQDEELGTARK